MKNQSIVFGLLLLISVLVPNSLFAQLTQDITMKISSSALIRVMPGLGASTGVTLTLGGPSEAGLEVKPVTEDVKTRLRISSLASGELPTDARKITAVISAGDMAGSRTMLELGLEAPTMTDDFVNFSPDGGVLAALQNLGDHTSNKPAITLVTGIYTCWSGAGDPADGYVIHYRYSKNIVTGTALPRAVTVTFTIGQ